MVSDKDTPESYNNNNNVINFDPSLSTSQLLCNGTGEELSSHDYVCELEEEDLSNVVYHGIDINLDLTHKCSNIGSRPLI